MNKGVLIAIRNCVLGPLLYFIVLWILEWLFDGVPTLIVAFSVMSVMIVDAAQEAFSAGKRAGGGAAPNQAHTQA